MSRQMLTLRLAERPKGNIIPGKTFSQERTAAPTEADLKENQVLLEVLYLSLDPAMRGWLDDKRSYTPPVKIGEVMRGPCLARVLASKASTEVSPGDFVTAFGNTWAEVLILPAEAVNRVDNLPENARLTDALNVLGGSGLTAYFGMTDIGRPRAGETVVVSGAAGATGSIAVQMAKMAGARVVGVTGSDEKARWLADELGVDAALNYRDAEFKRKFAEATPGFIDVFWDNVGGEQLDMALARANKGARFVECGHISNYNTDEHVGPKNIINVISMRIRMQGFIVLDLVERWGEARQQLAKWLSEGKLKRKETILKGGLAAAEDGLPKLFAGHNIGKMLVEVKNPDDGAKL